MAVIIVGSLLLMLPISSRQSTATPFIGGMKITTVAVLIATATSVFKKNDNPHILKRTIPLDAVRSAVTILMMYITNFLLGAVIISKIEALPLTECLYETASAICTVGLLVGITPTLETVSRIILMLLMFIGRVGGLTIMFAALWGKSANIVKYPQEKITVG